MTVQFSFLGSILVLFASITVIGGTFPRLWDGLKKGVALFPRPKEIPYMPRLSSYVLSAALVICAPMTTLAQGVTTSSTGAMNSVPKINSLKPGAMGSVLAYSEATDSVSLKKVVNGGPNASSTALGPGPYMFSVVVPRGFFRKNTTRPITPAIGFGPVAKVVGVREFVTSNSTSGDASAMGHGEFTGTGTGGTLSGSSLLVKAQASAAAGGSAEGAGYSNDPYTVLRNSAGTFEYNPTITNLSLSIQGNGLGGSSGGAGIEFAAYSSLVPTENGSLGMLWEAIVDLNTKGQVYVGFESAPILGLNNALEVQKIVDNLSFSTSDLSNLSIGLANPQGLELFDQTISAPQDFIMSETVASFAAASAAVPEPSTLVLAGIASAILVAVQGLRWRRRRIIAVAGLA